MKERQMGMCKCGGLRNSVPITDFAVPGTLLGVENVTLGNGVTEDKCDKCGRGKIHIEDLPGLIAAVALSRVKLPFKLNGTEIKFLRSALDVTAKDMASYLKVTPEALSRWENEKQPMGEQSEQLFRLVVIAMLQGTAKGVNPEMDAVARMQIQSAYDPAELAKLMHFVRLPTIVNRVDDPESLWRDERKAA